MICSLLSPVPFQIFNHLSLCISSYLNCLAVVLGQDRDLEEGGHVPVVLQGAETPLLPDQVVEDHPDPLELGTGGELLARHHQQGGQVNPRILVRLHLMGGNVFYNYPQLFREDNITMFVTTVACDHLCNCVTHRVRPK